MEYYGADLDGMESGENYYSWIFSRISPFLKGACAEFGAGIGTFSDRLARSGKIDSLDLFEPSVNGFSVLADRSFGDFTVK